MVHPKEYVNFNQVGLRRYSIKFIFLHSLCVTLFINSLSQFHLLHNMLVGSLMKRNISNLVKFNGNTFLEWVIDITDLWYKLYHNCNSWSRFQLHQWLVIIPVVNCYRTVLVHCSNTIGGMEQHHLYIWITPFVQCNNFLRW